MNVGYVISFAVGGAGGSLLTWLLLKEKYARIAQEEIDSVREIYARDGDRIKQQNEELESKKESDRRESNAKEVQNYAGMVNKLGYSEMSTAATKRWQESNHDPRVPYVISPMDYEDQAYAHYESVELSFYSDGVLANSRDEIITQQESYESIGPDLYRNLRDHFGEYEEDPDVVYIRNESNFIQYVITRDNRTYASVVGDIVG